MIKLKHLESALSQVDTFDPELADYSDFPHVVVYCAQMDRSAVLEQYPSTPHLAACMVHTAEERFEDIEGTHCPHSHPAHPTSTTAGKTVADLGCGTCMLSIAAAIVGAGSVLGVDIDPNALEIAAANVEGFEASPLLQYSTQGSHGCGAVA